VDWRLRDRIGVEHAPRRGEHQQAPGEALRAQPVGELAHVAAHQRLERRVDGGRRRAPVLAKRRVQAVRQRVRHAGQAFVEELTDSQLVPGVHDRPEQADRDSLDLQVAQPIDVRDDRLLVERT
jgi:hypothetical protein